MAASVPTHYETLSLARHAGPDLVRKAYRQLAQKYHPDKQQHGACEAQQVMARINDAYAVLSDPVRRASYDRWVEAHQARLAAERAVRAAAQPGGFSAAWPWYLLFATMTFTTAAVGTVAYTAAVPTVAAPFPAAVQQTAVQPDSAVPASAAGASAAKSH